MTSPLSGDWFRGPVVAVTLAIAGAAIACSSPPAPEPVEPDDSKAVDAEPAPPDDGIPATPAGQRLRWFLGMLNGKTGVPDQAEYGSIFAAGFIAKVPHAQFASLSEQLRAGAPYSLVEIKDGATDTRLVAVLSVQDKKLAVFVSTSGDANQIEGLLIKPHSDVKPLTSWDDLAARLDATGEKAQFLAARLQDGSCEPMAADQPSDHLGIGSTFKLYVLLALHQRIQSSKLRWDTELAIRDDQKSLPSGTMQTLDAGTKKPIEEFALKMISISDNTATDHLLYLLGRERVEKAMSSSGHSAPQKNTPFLATREFFALKLAVDDAAREAFIKMSAKQKRRYADQTLKTAKVTLDMAGDWTTPRQIDTLEWFASPFDLCGVMAALKTAGDTSPEIRKVLSANPGVEIDSAVWTYAGYKGGSEPGVMNLTWLLQHASGGWYVFTLGVNDTAKGLDDAQIAGLAQAALAYFGAEVAKGDAGTGP